MNQRPAPAVNPKPASAAVAGHFGELAQGLAGPGGPVALVTLPCPALVTVTRYAPRPGALEVAEPVSAKALGAARATLALLGRAGWGGRLEIARPQPPGLGAGSSTAETLGAVRAVAGAFDATLDPAREAALCLEAEGAIDPLMHEGTVLFASRRGVVLRPLPPLPPMRILGGFAAGARATDPADDAFPEMGAVFAEIEAALAAGDLARLGAAATRSAEANQRRNPNPAWEAIRRLARESGAAGIAVAHTGTAIALLCPPGTDTRPLVPALLAAGLRSPTEWSL